MKAPILALAAAAVLAVSGCETQNQTQATAAGAVTGGVLGGLASGSLGGAAVGAATGAAAGNLIGRAADAQGMCVYQRPNGTRYRAACPNN